MSATVDDFKAQFAAKMDILNDLSDTLDKGETPNIGSLQQDVSEICQAVKEANLQAEMQPVMHDMIKRLGEVVGKVRAGHENR